MNSDLQQKLFEKYPKIFKNANETSLYFSIECDDGWYMLIDKLCYFLQSRIDNNNHPQITALQVKETFGLLRFYTSGESNFQEGAIRFAEVISSSICEKCGSTNDVSETGASYIKYYCKGCRGNKKIFRR